MSEKSGRERAFRGKAGARFVAVRPLKFIRYWNKVCLPFLLHGFDMPDFAFCLRTGCFCAQSPGLAGVWDSAPVSSFRLGERDGCCLEFPLLRLLSPLFMVIVGSGCLRGVWPAVCSESVRGRALRAGTFALSACRSVRWNTSGPVSESAAWEMDGRTEFPLFVRPESTSGAKKFPFARSGTPRTGATGRNSAGRMLIGACRSGFPRYVAPVFVRSRCPEFRSATCPTEPSRPPPRPSSCRAAPARSEFRSPACLP